MSISTATNLNLLRFHRAEGEIYEKVMSEGVEAAEAKNVVALWMWLDALGFRHFLVRVRTTGNRDLFRVLLQEAAVILRCVRQGVPPASPHGATVLSRTALSARDPLNLRFFYVNRDLAVRSVVSILDGVGRVIFDDVLVRAARDADAGRPVAAALRAALDAPYEPPEEAIYDDSRCMLLTFPPGQPLSAQQVVDYFVGKWGSCVERVEMDRHGAGAGGGEGRAAAPTYGRVIFTEPWFVGLFLKGERFAEFDIDGNLMWGRSFVPWINTILPFM